MEKTLTVRNVPGRVVEALKKRARRNHRSMQSEVLAILDATVSDTEALSSRLAEHRLALTRPMTMDEIRAAMDRGRP